MYELPNLKLPRLFQMLTSFVAAALIIMNQSLQLELLQGFTNKDTL